MATDTELKPVVDETVTPTAGISDLSTADRVEVQNAPQVPDAAEEPEYEPLSLDSDVQDGEKTKKKAEDGFSTGNDFYDNFIKSQNAAEFSYDLQSADSYWNNRPETRAEYEAKYGDKAEEKFREYYDTEVEPLWRKKDEANTQKVVLNENYKWLFGEGENRVFDSMPTFEVVDQIYNGSRRIDTMLSDKTMSDRAAMLRPKKYMNDQGQLVELSDDEKYWSWSKGEGTKMNYDDPKHRSKDGRKIVGFQYPQLDPEYRGDGYVQAVYDGDIVKGEVVSMWDTTNTWMNGTGLKESTLSMLPRTAMRTVVGAAGDMLTGTLSLLNSAVQLAENLGDNDDESRLNDWLNNAVLAINTRTKVSKSEYDQAKTITASNMLDFVAQVAAQLYSGSAIFKGTQALTKVFLAGNPLLKAAKAAEAAKDFKKAKSLVSQFEMQYGRAARAASLYGMTLQTGESVVEEARAAGFSEDEVAAIYLSYFGMMLGANQISMRMLDPYFTKATATPIFKEMLKKHLGSWNTGATDVAKLGWAKRLITKTADALEKAPIIAAKAGHTDRSMWVKGLMYKGLNEAMEEEVEFVGQEAVELMATQVSKRLHKGDEKIPQYDTFLEDGYWARQLPNIVMSGIGGFMGGAFTQVLPGFNHENEHSFLIKGPEETRMIKLAMADERTKQFFRDTVKKQHKAGAMGSHALSTKINEKTGEFYKMTDPEAKGEISHADASYRGVMGQFAYYEALYGDAKMSYDELIKLDPALQNELSYSSKMNMGARIASLHLKKRDILNELMGNTKTAPLQTKPVAATAAGTVTAAPTTPKPPAVAPGTTPGITVPQDEDMDDTAAKAAEKFTAKVKDRANLLGTTNYSRVQELVEIEDEIDDILSGKAAAAHAVKAVIRNHKIGVFDPDKQGEILSKIKDSTGKEISSPFSKFGDKLLDAVLSADIALSKGHTQRHLDYIDARARVDSLISSAFTKEDIERLAGTTATKPSSIAIDRYGLHLSKLKDGVNKLINAEISQREIEDMALEAKRNLGITEDTQFYIQLISDAYTTFSSNKGFDEESTMEMSVEDRTEFVETNIDIIHKLSLSTIIDQAAADPISFLSAKINTDRAVFTEQILREITGPDANILEGMNVNYDSRTLEISTQITEATKTLTDLDALVPKTPLEAQNREDDLFKAKMQLAALETALEASKRMDSMNGTLDAVIRQLGPEVVRSISTEKDIDDLTPLVERTTPNIASARALVTNYNTILANIAPRVPSVQRFGAVTNLLNELSVEGENIASSLSKIINSSIDAENFIVTPEGNVVPSNTAPSKIDELGKLVLNPGTEAEEFHAIDTAKLLLDAVEIRMGQAKIMGISEGILGKLYRYTKEYIPEGKTRYDLLPKFMAEHVYDPDRYKVLAAMTVRSAEEEREFAAIDIRRQMLLDETNPNSVPALLAKAKKELLRIIEIGNKSNTAESRSRVYKVDLAKSLNTDKFLIEKRLTVLSTLSPELTDAVKSFLEVADTYSYSEPEKLKEGYDALNAVYNAIYNLSADAKDTLINTNDLSNYGSDSMGGNITWNIFNSMATNPELFDKYYNDILPNSDDDNAIAPTYQQEQMVRSIFSFIVDNKKVFPLIKENKRFPLFMMVNGEAGTGKSTMAVYGLGSAQKYLDDTISVSLKAKYDPRKSYNGVVFAGYYKEQAEALKDKAEGLGIRSAGAPMGKAELFNMFKTDGLYENISIVAFDEATFIQSAYAKDGNPTELEYLHSRLESINTLRQAEGLPPIKVVLIGDDTQGGWQVNMPTVFDTAVDWYQPLDYKNLGEKPSLIREDGDRVVMSTKALSYRFRTLCAQVSVTSKQLSKISTEATAVSTAVMGVKRTHSIPVSYGVISNDALGRLGGVKTSISVDALFKDDEVLDNIKRQIDEDKKDTAKPDKKRFSVIIVHNTIRSASNLGTEYQKLKDLIDKNSTYFKFETVESVQGMEADYILADLTEVMTKLPVLSSQDQVRTQKSAMVVARARLFASIAMAPEVQVDPTNNTLITMISEEEANTLTVEWNKFYLDELRKAPKKAAGASAGTTTSASTATSGAATGTSGSGGTTPSGPSTTPLTTEDAEKEAAKHEAEIKAREASMGALNTAPAGTSLGPVVPMDIPSEDVEVIDQYATNAEAALTTITNADAVLKSAVSTAADKAAAKAAKDEAMQSFTELIDLVETPGKLVNELVATFEAVDDVTEARRTSDGDKKVLEKEELKHRIIRLYTNIKSLKQDYDASTPNYDDDPDFDIQVQHKSQTAQNIESKVYYAHDLFGGKDYKEQVTVTKRDGTATKTFSLKKTAIDETRQAQEDFYNKKYSDYVYSIVTAEVADEVEKVVKTVIVHQVYAQRAGKPKVLIGQLPTTTLSEFGDTKKLLIAREERLALFAQSTKLLRASSDATIAGMFDDAKAREDAFGVAGLPMSDAAIAKIQTALDKIGIKKILPLNTKRTTFGRTALSDQSIQYRYNVGTHKKSSDDRLHVGTFYMETEIENPEAVFAGVTAGRPLRDVGKSNIRDINNTVDPYVMSLPTTGYYKSDVLTAIQGTIPKGGKVTNEAIKQLATAASKPLVQFKTTDGPKSVFQVEIYKAPKPLTIMAFKGLNGRNTVYAAYPGEKFQILYGFDMVDKPILSPAFDLETAAVISSLGKNAIDMKKDVPDVISPKIISPDDAQYITASVYKYDLEKVNKLSSSIEFERAIMEEHQSKPVIDFSDYQIPVSTLRKVLDENSVQMSAPLVVKDKTLDGKAGSIFALYTYRTDVDLSDKTTLERLLARRSGMSKTTLESDPFSVTDYAKDGIGVLMLDTQMSSLVKLSQMNRAGVANLNLSTSPASSEANKRMVMFTKEMAQIVREVLSFENDAQLRNRLDKVGIASDGTVLAQIFSEDSKKAIRERLLHLRGSSDPKDQAVVNSLIKFFSLITLDNNMGKLAISYGHIPGRLGMLLSIRNPQARLQYWDNEFVTKASSITPEEQQFITDKKLTRDNLSQFKESTEEAMMRGEISKGKFLLRPGTSDPLISNPEGAITFVPALEFVSGESVRGKASFNMTNFLTLLDVAAGDAATAELVAGELDSIMTKLSNPGTLNRGVAWSGKINRVLHKDLGVAMLDPADAELLITSAKAINQPTMLLNVDGLIEQMSIAETPKAPTAPRPEDTEAIRVGKFIGSKATLTESIAKLLTDISSAKDLNTLKGPLKIAVDNIVQQFSAEKHLYKPDEFTIMDKKIKSLQRALSDRITYVNKLIADAEEAARKAKSKLPVPDEDDEGEDYIADLATYIAAGVDGLNALLTEINTEVQKEFNSGKAITDDERYAFNMFISTINEEIAKATNLDDATKRNFITQFMSLKMKYEGDSTKTPGQTLVTTMLLLNGSHLVRKEEDVLVKVGRVLDTKTFTADQKLSLGYLQEILEDGDIMSITDIPAKMDAKKKVSTVLLDIDMMLRAAKMDPDDRAMFNDLLRKSRKDRCKR